METSTDAIFNRNYQLLLQHRTLKGVQPKMIDAYSRAIRRVGERFDRQIDSLSAQQLTDYFTELVESHSWSTVKLDLTGAPAATTPLDRGGVQVALRQVVAACGLKKRSPRTA